MTANGQYDIRILAPGMGYVDRETAVSVAQGHMRGVSSLTVAEVGPDGRALFGNDAEVMCRRTQYGENADATVSIGGISSHSPERARVRIACYQLAIDIAAEANQAAAEEGR
jgi:hypothetical protein